MLTGTLIISLFLLLRNARAPYILYTHFYNLLFILAAVVYTVRAEKKRNSHRPYLACFVSGMLTAGIAAVCFDIFLLLYLYFINPVYYLNQISYTPLGEYMNGLVICVMFLAEQLSAATIFSLITLQLYKN